MESDPHDKKPEEDVEERLAPEAKWSGRAEPLPDPNGDWRNELVRLPEGSFPPPDSRQAANPNSGSQSTVAPEGNKLDAPEAHGQPGPGPIEPAPPSEP